MLLKKFLYYLNPKNYFRTSKEDDINVRLMHGINKISILLFMFALMLLIYRWLR